MGPCFGYRSDLVGRDAATVERIVSASTREARMVIKRGRGLAPTVHTREEAERREIIEEMWL
jgi:hypothetical protein